MIWKLVRHIERTLVVVAMTAFVVMLVATVSQVMFRYVLMISVSWTEELARILFVVSMFLGLAVATLRGEHIVVDFLLKRFRPPTVSVLQTLFALAAIAFLLVLGWGAIVMAKATWGTYFVAIGWFRLGYVYLAEVVGVTFTILFLAVLTAQSLRLIPPRDDTPTSAVSETSST